MSETAAEQDFRADLRDVLEIEPEPTIEEPVAEGDPADGGPPRDDQGRFAAAEPDPADADVQAYLAKYGGDPDKALRGAAEQAKLLGRQSQELGDLRKLSEQMDALRADLTPEQEVDADELAAYADSNPREAAAWALQNGDWASYGAVLEQWKDVDPFAAADFHSDVKLAQMQQQIAAQQQPFQAELQARDLGLAMQQVTQEFPELRDEAHVDTLLREAPRMPQILVALSSGTVGEKAQAMRALALIGRGLRNGDTLAAPPPGQAAPAVDAGRLAKTVSGLASGSYAPAREAPSADAKARAWFREQIGPLREE